MNQRQRQLRAKAKARKNRLMRNPLGASKTEVVGIMRSLNRDQQIRAIKREIARRLRVVGDLKVVEPKPETPLPPFLDNAAPETRERVREFLAKESEIAVYGPSYDPHGRRPVGIVASLTNASEDSTLP